MVYVAVLAVGLLPYIRSVKVVIDGTIDFGPNWNVEYNVKSINNGLEPRKAIRDDHNVLINNEGNDLATTEILEDTSNNKERPAILVNNDSLNGKANQEINTEVTRLYATDFKTVVLFNKPRKIKQETNVMQFVEHIKNETLKMFDNVLENLDDKEIIQKIAALKDRYANKFSEFTNQTKHHTIRTTVGSKNVIVNAIDYSCKLLNRLVTRFDIDVEDNKLRSGMEISKSLKIYIDNLKSTAHEDACKEFHICRVGHEFCDHIGNLLETLLKKDDAKIEFAVEAIGKNLKNADLDNIMDDETQRAFRNGLTTVEELTPFEQRVLLMAYKLIIDNRHKPYLDKDPDNQWVKATVALYNVMEGFNRKIIIDEKDWNTIEKDFDRSLNKDKAQINDVVKKLIDHIQRCINALDDKSSKDFKTKLRMCMLASPLRVSFSSFVQFQPFII